MTHDELTTKIQSTYLDLKAVVKDIDSINPNCSLYAKLKEKKVKLAGELDALEKLKDNI